jgi:hypothetical protein
VRLASERAKSKRFMRWWREERSKNIALRDSFESLITMVLKQANEVKDKDLANQCAAMLESLRIREAPAQMLTRLPIDHYEICRQAKILADSLQ